MGFASTHNEVTIQLSVAAREYLTPDIIELEFTSIAPLPSWNAGAHVDLHLPSGLVRQYSLIRGKIESKNWRIAVLIEREGRGGSLEIERELIPGVSLVAVGPRNHFPLVHSQNRVFLAGGIGITPILGMIDESEVSGISWELFYLGRSRSTMAYLESLDNRWGSNIHVFAGDEGRRFEVSQLTEKLTAGTHVYSCGPERLLVELDKLADSVATGQVHVERFHPRRIQDAPNRPFFVECARSGIEFEVDVDESIFMMADFAGIVVEGDCMEGTCGSCETRIISGEVTHRDSVLSAEARKENETMMICVSRAKNDRITLDI